MGSPDKAKVTALQRNAAGLFKLLGGDSDDRLRFWEIFKGITTPAEIRLIDQQLTTATDLVDQVTASIKALQKTAAGIKG